MIDYKNELNEEQYKVVTEGDGHCLVLAGAGSGKTRTIIYRVAYLLENGLAPEEILLVTFTNKASREMIRRAVELTGKENKLPWAGTFHHICYRILKKYSPLLGYKNNFTILDSGDSRDLIKLCIKSEGIDVGAKRFPSARVLQSIFSYSQNAMMTIEDVVEMKYPQWIPMKEQITHIAVEYHRKKKESNAMDFDDLLVNTCLLLSKSTKVREKFSKQFKYVLVDEYQDTNKIQATIIKLFSIHNNNLLVVGDDAQSIYSFRAAEIKNILDFGKHFSDAKIYKLETNYRSTPEILDVANQVISNNMHQHEKELRAHNDSFVKPEIHAFADRDEEAEFIVQRLLELHNEGVDLDNMAILFRASHHSQALEVELTRRNIPYEYRGGVRFFERSHIKDVLAYLRVFANDNDTVAWSRVLNMQIGIGPSTVQKIILQIREGKDMEEITGTLSVRAKIGWNDFMEVYKKLEQANSKEPSHLIMAVRHSKYEQYLQSEHPNYRERLQDIEQLAQFAEKQKDLAVFLAEASLQESYATPTAKSTSDDEEVLILSTVHQAKGLEWSAVFILNLTSGQFPNDRALREHRGVEEERRLFYVAVTRAKKHLYLTYPVVGGFNVMSSGPSMFLEEIENSSVSREGGIGGSIWTDPSDDSDDVTYIDENDEWSNKKHSFLADISDL